MSQRLKKILIIQTASLGDVILSTPIIEKLSNSYPDAKIDFLLKYGYEGLLRRHPKLHHVIVWDKTERKYHHLVELIRIIRENKYDAVINVQRFVSSGLITALSGSKMKAGFSKNPFSLFFNHRVKHKIGSRNSSHCHEVGRNLKLIEHITDDKAKYLPKLYPLQQDYAKVSQYTTRKYITVSPGSLWFTKQYPEEKWIEFISGIDDDITVYLLGSDKEKDLCNRIIETSGNKQCLNLAGKLSFLESTALMEKAVMNYVNDSAPMHMASSVNAPVAAVYCSTIPEFGFGPLSDESHVIEVEEELDCRPCGLHGWKKCPENHFNCAKNIKKEQLQELIR